MPSECEFVGRILCPCYIVSVLFVNEVPSQLSAHEL